MEHEDWTARASRRGLLSALALGPVMVAGAAAAAEAPVTTGVPPGFRSSGRDLGGLPIHVVIGGQGPPILLLHGWPETWFEWRKVMPLLARDHTVIAPDLRGFGDSGLAAAGYDKKTLAQDMRRLMLSLDFPRATVIGHDWGGPVAYAYAAQFREGVDRLVMIEGAPFGPWMPNPNIAWFFDFLRIPGFAEALLPGRERAFLRWFYDNPLFHAVPGTFGAAEIDTYVRAYARSGRMDPTYGLYRTIDQDIRDNADFARTPLAIPVLAVGAERGSGVLVFENARRVASRVTTVLFRETGHFIPEERPQALVEAISAFLADRPIASEWRQSEG